MENLTLEFVAAANFQTGIDEQDPSQDALVDDTQFKEHLYTTLISLFWLIGMPLLIVLCGVVWHIWTMFCSMLEAMCSDSDYLVDLATINECTNPQVAKILSPLPPDFDFKHVCETKVAKAHIFARPLVTV
ncbi:hypothetical protein RRG08_011501 [Elysia crispata]|uniref:Uncharacterized protein n=1 Tax=Elysia crispata TaxID=231223 RepID=A0AAE1A8I1_9GAST|nr:hypothetical protein RRG08_011501 [Elysia crispata]